MTKRPEWPRFPEEWEYDFAPLSDVQTRIPMTLCHFCRRRFPLEHAIVGIRGRNYCSQNCETLQIDTDAGT